MQSTSDLIKKEYSWPQIKREFWQVFQRSLTALPLFSR